MDKKNVYFDGYFYAHRVNAFRVVYNMHEDDTCVTDFLVTLLGEVEKVVTVTFETNEETACDHYPAWPKSCEKDYVSFLVYLFDTYLSFDSHFVPVSYKPSTKSIVHVRHFVVDELHVGLGKSC